MLCHSFMVAFSPVTHRNQPLFQLYIMKVFYCLQPSSSSPSCDFHPLPTTSFLSPPHRRYSPSLIPLAHPRLYFHPLVLSCLHFYTHLHSTQLISTLLYCCRNPGLDDQAVFWKVIRRSSDPPINPIGICKHLESAPRIPDLILGGNHTILPLSTCYLNLCLFSSGMLSRLYLPEYTYGASIALHDFFHRFCSSISLIAYLLHVNIAQKR